MTPISAVVTGAESLRTASLTHLQFVPKHKPYLQLVWFSTRSGKDLLKPAHSVIGQLWDLSVSLPNSAHVFSWASNLRKAMGFVMFHLRRSESNMFGPFRGRTMAWWGPPEAVLRGP